MSNDGFSQGFTNRSIFPEKGGDDAQGHSIEWWQKHRRGAGMQGVPAIHRAYVRLGFILSALAKLLTAEEVEAA